MHIHGMRPAILAVALAAGLAVPQGMRAQDPGGGPSIGCFRGRPFPACRSFWLIEMQGSTPLAQTSRTVQWGWNAPQVRQDAIRETLEWNLGHMVNVTPTFALGALFTIGTGNDDVLTGMKLRARRWISKDVSLELEGGILRTNANNAVFPGISGSTADLRLNIRDQGSFFVRWDGVRLPSVEPILVPGDFGYSDPGGFQHGISVGVSAGSLPALVGSGALGLAYTILLALWLSE